jgi:hypothetical protein
MSELVAQMGMPGLPTMRKLGNINRLFSMWLLSLLDPATMLLDLGEGEFLEVSDEAIGRALGVNATGEVIDMRAPANKEDLLARVHTVLGTGLPRATNVPLAKLRSIIQDAEKLELNEAEKVKQMAAYVMVAAATFLLPRGASVRVPDEILGVSVFPEEMSRYNIARFVADGLRESARKVREMLPLDPTQPVIDGCHFVLQVRFMHPCSTSILETSISSPGTDSCLLTGFFCNYGADIVPR